ncbi:hypothetical protein EDM53_00425 [Rickettsiales endosymbiont of Peranema trichophorum]|uniref:hypothetical protein n=1 Tax=Rickettsiales endosymbiont of Peranema trichophorum TaxID=2486577 RepID=UPI001022CEED|nr:hypothetical protein [Rickettsiales endosymbiont of Peranema trichophorum]RZI47753.1 hypothetical protein EDM53_00425 [Rickettsiales endosymbiont of Peranema trichophorum]
MVVYNNLGMVTARLTVVYVSAKVSASYDPIGSHCTTQASLHLQVGVLGLGYTTNQVMRVKADGTLNVLVRCSINVLQTIYAPEIASWPAGCLKELIPLGYGAIDMMTDYIDLGAVLDDMPCAFGT